MPQTLLEDHRMKFGATTFFARPHKGETCGSNGLPLTPNSITIHGRGQFLKSLAHPHLCQYLDIIRGKHERLVVVSQFCGEPLASRELEMTTEETIRMAYETASALHFMHSQGLVHRNLCPKNILIQTDGQVKLFNYGLFYMTDGGKHVLFPIGQPVYTAPEVFLDRENQQPENCKADVWSLGMILAELLFSIHFWKNLKVGQCLRKVLTLINCNTSILERIAREHNCMDKYQNIPQALKELVESCLSIFPKDRPDMEQILASEIFDSIRPEPENNSIFKRRHKPKFSLAELYYWWQLAGGDVISELKKQGLIRSTPPILSLPNIVLLDGTTLGQKRDQTALYDDRTVQMPLDALVERLGHLPITSYFPLVHCKSEKILKYEQHQSNTSNLPLVIRERDPEYQFHRVVLFRRLLEGYPYYENQIISEAKADIPPMLRGRVWAALLSVQGNFEEKYSIIDKETPTSTDRQIEVDIPRCHQYNELLSSSEGHRKLNRILKAWVASNPQYVYWQGLDSLTAPFLYLNFNNEALAFACLSNFIPKYLHKFFLKDNSAVIQEYLAKFKQIISFQDPELANHLNEITFNPELFAIPWFLTMFSHVFPLHKILHLWDKLLLGDASFPIFIGLSVLHQLRTTLLSSGFNECILLFSDLPEIDIEACVTYSVQVYENTPRSITARDHENKLEPSNEFDISGVTIKELNQEYAPRISLADLVNLLETPDRCIVIDIRNEQQFTMSNIKTSINIPTANLHKEPRIEHLGNNMNVFKNNTKITIVVSDNHSTAVQFGEYLVKCGIKNVSVLHGGFALAEKLTPTILV